MDYSAFLAVGQRRSQKVRAHLLLASTILTPLQVQGISDVQTEAPDKAILQLEERTGSQPDALKAWFYPGDNFGVEFVYPTQK